jgi:hypothetical protein
MTHNGSFDKDNLPISRHLNTPTQVGITASGQIGAK